MEGREIDKGRRRKRKKGASAWDRTKDLSVNSRSLCRLSHGSFLKRSEGESISNKKRGRRRETRTIERKEEKGKGRKRKQREEQGQTGRET